MSAYPPPIIRIRLDPLNPGHFLACCGVLELAERSWGGAEGWFEGRADFFCAAPVDPEASKKHAGLTILEQLKHAELVNMRITDEQLRRLDELAVATKKSKKSDPDAMDRESHKLASEKKKLDALWDEVKDGALFLGAPFDLRLDWYLDAKTGAGRFKTWAGQQNITDIALELKNAIPRVLFVENSEWLFATGACQTSLHLDAIGGGTDLDIGFSFDPLKIRAAEKRPLVEILALIGLQRFSPRQVGENRYTYSAWHYPIAARAAQGVARGFGAASAHAFEFRLLYRSKYLKSFLPAQLRSEQR